MDELLRKSALDYHRLPTPGKISVVPTKALHQPARSRARLFAGGRGGLRGNRARIPTTARSYTARGNLIGVITNGTAVLGLGPIGPLAGKPVMEGKGVLFKKFAGIDVFDIEINERDPDKLVEHHRQPGADLRRHQSRRHQGAGMLLHRDASCAAG